MVPPNHPRENQLLAALPPTEWDRLRPHLDLVSLSFGRELNDASGEMRHAYFPVSCSVSLVAMSADGSTADIATVGHKGMVGVTAFMGGGSMFGCALVRTAGYAYRIKASQLQSEFHNMRALRHFLLLYTQALLTQIGQVAVCNRRHSVQQQLCRCLLGMLDRPQSSNQLAMTQESIANMLGVRREAVTEAAGKLQQADTIRYSRGKITVLDRAALEAQVCECYQMIKTEFDRLLPEEVTG